MIYSYNHNCTCIKPFQPSSSTTSCNAFRRRPRAKAQVQALVANPSLSPTNCARMKISSHLGSRMMTALTGQRWSCYLLTAAVAIKEVVWQAIQQMNRTGITHQHENLQINRAAHPSLSTSESNLDSRQKRASSTRLTRKSGGAAQA